MSRHEASAAQRVAATDRAAAERDDPKLLDGARADGATRVVVVRGAHAALAEGSPRLLGIAPSDVPGDAEWGFLGRTADGAAVLVAAFDASAAEPLDPPGGWAGPRELAAELDPAEADTLVVAVSLGRWLTGHRFCPTCGGRAILRQAGWSRRCEACGRDHFPRNDPAVIVAITDAERRRILLGANVNWRGRMHSCFAGFVEAGESLETAIHREICEEAGVRLTGLRYSASQPWPYPHSLMLGFEATAVDPDEARADGAEIVSLRWFTRAEIGAALEGRGEVGLPGPASIAHRLIRDWFEEGDA
ncbi:NAD(+) diphosphatase [Microbacterium sp.]|uniref:NAD(+) diphosphatase n=1 Tax=Microbacterium sp. TaxID=51671 RepID=UPI002811A709|nr:NAD(+) diphosphatase [Microbacterium sp.]